MDLGGESRADVMVLTWGLPSLATSPLPAVLWQGAELLPLFQVPVFSAQMVALQQQACSPGAQDFHKPLLFGVTHTCISTHTTKDTNTSEGTEPCVTAQSSA